MDMLEAAKYGAGLKRNKGKPPKIDGKNMFFQNCDLGLFWIFEQTHMATDEFT